MSENVCSGNNFKLAFLLISMDNKLICGKQLIVYWKRNILIWNESCIYALSISAGIWPAGDSLHNGQNGMMFSTFGRDIISTLKTVQNYGVQKEILAYSKMLGKCFSVNDIY